jgi:hypothetical protein
MVSQDKLFEIAKSFSDGIKELSAEADRLVPYFISANIWFPHSATGHLIHRIKALVDAGNVTPSDIQAEFIRYFEEEDWKYLCIMVESWMNNSFFTPRKEIILDSLDAHVRGTYTLSIPTLLPQVEGIASEILEKPVGSIARLTKEAVKGFSKGRSRDKAELEGILNLLTNPVYFGSPPSGKDSTRLRFSNWINQKGKREEEIINRDAILHGFHIKYASKLNSLRVFLVLDLLYWMKNDEWDERLKTLLRMYARK